ncbi:MAG: hypothetical protein K6G28_01260 [Acholeplasmatales bacterium]|nr:hypothetical protein [Acholeplasmatales bacterium]
MFFILFGIENDALTVKTLYNGVKDDYIYVLNPSLREIKEIEGEIALYKDVYIKINDEDIKVIYMNKEASKIGVPYYENSFIKLDEALAPGFYSNVNQEGFTYLKNISLPNFNNNMTNRNYNTEVFFCITDDYDYKDPSLVVCKDNEQNHKLFYIDNNDDFVELSCANGEQIKKYYKGVYNSTIVLMSLLAYVLYILSIWLLFNFIFLIINSNYFIKEKRYEYEAF